MGFVLVQHLDPTHESRLAELLARRTPLPVIESTDGLTVKPDHVYVIPPNQNLAVSGGRLKLIPRRTGEIPPMPIDLLLRSLALAIRNTNAVGIIFSGNGSDGTLGLEAIKGSDGITFAQDPKTAKYEGMPCSAIASGCVDFIFTPDRIARELVNLPLKLNGDLSEADETEDPAAEPDGPLFKIYSLLRSASGVDFASYKQSTLKRRIQRRMVVHRLGKLDDYIRHLQSDPGEVQALFEDALITVTRFFRELKSFEALTRRVFPALIRNRHRKQPIRVWVPACSSGEEAYSIAISLVEFLTERGADHPIQIFGTDVSETMIVKARAGIYRANITQDVSGERLKRFFNRTDEGYRISKKIRELCVFARQNLGADPPFSNIDLISCQNVMIYFGPQLQKQVIPMFHYALKPGGFLLLSPAEGVGSFSKLFAPLNKKQRIYVKTSPATKPRIDFSPKVFQEDITAAKPVQPAPPEYLLPEIEKAADSILLRHFTPSGVIIGRDMQVLQFRGITSPYLEHAPGVASLNLLKMVRADLVIPLRTAIAQSLKKHQAVWKEVEWTTNKNQQHRIKLEVVHFKVTGAKEPFMLVLFEEGSLLSAPPLRIDRASRGRARNGKSTVNETEIIRLREELETSRESFQAIVEEQEATNEELKSANEEIQSSNEELQSTNEELETSKEEMQSANEELATVNEELQHANLNAGSANNDLINLLASTQIPVVMVDNDLIIRRFTPSAQKCFNLIPSDVGPQFQ